MIIAAVQPAPPITVRYQCLLAVTTVVMEHEEIELKFASVEKKVIGYAVACFFFFFLNDSLMGVSLFDIDGKSVSDPALFLT